MDRTNKAINADKNIEWFNRVLSKRKQKNLLMFLTGVLMMLILCRCGSVSDPVIKEVEVPVEKIVYREPEKIYQEEAEMVARVLYGLKDYQLTVAQKTAVIEVILNRVADTACEFRTLNTVADVCNQPNQWQGYSEHGSFLQADYQIALDRLNDKSGARVIPEGCYFLTVGHGSVEVRTLFSGGNKWSV